MLRHVRGAARRPLGPPAWRGARLALALLVLLPLLSLLAACDDDAGPDSANGDGRSPTSEATATSGAGGDDAFPVTVEDSSGAEVSLDAPPQRIISYSPGATEILFAIGAGDRVVATDEFSNYPEEAVAALPKLTYTNPDPESALALTPDLVLMEDQQREQVEQFRDLGMTVAFLESPQGVEGVLDSIGTLGRLTGNSTEADALVADMRQRTDAVTSALSEAGPGPRVFVELTSDLYTAAPDTFVGDLLTLVGAANIAEGSVSPFPQLTAEAVVDADPEVILLGDAAFGENPESACARPAWDAITACVDGRVHPFDPDLLSRPGPRVADALELVARLLYPDRFDE